MNLLHGVHHEPGKFPKHFPRACECNNVLPGDLWLDKKMGAAAPISAWLKLKLELHIHPGIDRTAHAWNRCAPRRHRFPTWFSPDRHTPHPEEGCRTCRRRSRCRHQTGPVSTHSCCAGSASRSPSVLTSLRSCDTSSLASTRLNFRSVGPVAETLHNEPASHSAASCCRDCRPCGRHSCH